MSNKKSSPSSSIVVGNDDLLIEILLFLAAKSLFRFKVVAKRWLSVISAPSFCHRHTVNYPRCRPEIQPLFIFGFSGSGYHVYDHTVPRFFPFLFPSGFSEVCILQSCHGLLLLRCGKAEKRDSYSYHVLNPTTMQQRELSPLPSGRSTFACLYLMFDPSLSPHYRVVCFQYAKKCTRIYVYDSKSHQWKLEGECNKNVKSFRDGIYFNGGIYFVRFGRCPSSRFDLDDYVSKIPNPLRRPTPGRQQMNYAIELNGVLLCLTLSWMEGSCLLDVLEMKENENRWSNKYHTDLQPILAACGEQPQYIRFLDMIMGEKERDSMLLLSLPGMKNVIYRFYDDGFEVYDFTSW